MRTCETLAIDRLASRSVEASEVAALQHELQYMIRTEVSMRWREEVARRTFGMTRWKTLPLYPKPCWPVASSRKFLAVLGTVSSYNLNTNEPLWAVWIKKNCEYIPIRPFGLSLIAMSNYDAKLVKPRLEGMNTHWTYENVGPTKRVNECQFSLYCSFTHIDGFGAAAERYLRNSNDMLGSDSR